MKNVLRALSIALVATIAAMGAGEAKASLYELNVVLNGNPPPGGAAPWMTAQFTDDPNNANNVLLTITNQLNVAGEFTSKFGFNVADYSPDTLSIVQQNAGPVTSVQAGAQDAQKLAGVKGFDILLTWTTSNGAGSDRFDAPEVLIFSISKAGTDLNVADFDELDANGAAHVAAKIQGLSGGGSTVIGDLLGPSPAPPVATPEPSTFLMGGLALIGLGLARFRGSKKS